MPRGLAMGPSRRQKPPPHLRFRTNRLTGDIGFKITAYWGSDRIGWIECDVLGPVVMVGYIRVVLEWQRQGIGTKLYTRAAHLACAEYGLPLGSDDLNMNNVSECADPFWRKQVSKGRAEVKDVQAFWQGDNYYARRYVLTCPPPKALDGF